METTPPGGTPAPTPNPAAHVAPDAPGSMLLESSYDDLDGMPTSLPDVAFVMITEGQDFVNVADVRRMRLVDPAGINPVVRVTYRNGDTEDYTGPDAHKMIAAGFFYRVDVDGAKGAAYVPEPAYQIASAPTAADADQLDQSVDAVVPGVPAAQPVGLDHAVAAAVGGTPEGGPHATAEKHQPRDPSKPGRHNG